MADISTLAEYLIAFHSEKYKRPVPPLSASTLMLMKTHSWSGNIRELENLMKRYVVLGTEEVITKELKWRTMSRIDMEIAPDELHRPGPGYARSGQGPGEQDHFEHAAG